MMAIRDAQTREVVQRSDLDWEADNDGELGAVLVPLSSGVRKGHAPCCSGRLMRRGSHDLDYADERQGILQHVPFLTRGWSPT